MPGDKQVMDATGRPAPRMKGPAMSREELIELLEQGLDQGLSGDAWRRALDALAGRGDAAEILAAVHALARAAEDLRAACDAAPVPADLEAGILRALAAETAPRTAAAPASRLLDRLTGHMGEFKARSAAAVRSAGRALSPGDLAAVAAARGPMAPPEPSLGTRPEEEVPEGAGFAPAPLPQPGPAPAEASIRPAIQAAAVPGGVVQFAPGSGTRIVAEDSGATAVDLGPLGPPAMGGWILHLERGAVAEEHPDRLVLTGDAEGVIVLPDGSMLAFGPVAEIRWSLAFSAVPTPREPLPRP